MISIPGPGGGRPFNILIGPIHSATTHQSIGHARPSVMIFLPEPEASTIGSAVHQFPILMIETRTSSARIKR
jgi:hypothetical protein